MICWTLILLPLPLFSISIFNPQSSILNPPHIPAIIGTHTYSDINTIQLYPPYHSTTPPLHHTSCPLNGHWISVWSVTDRPWAHPIARKHVVWPSWMSKTPPADRVRPQHIGPRLPKHKPSPPPPRKHLSPPSKATNLMSPTAFKTNCAIMQVVSIKSATSNGA